MESDTPKPTRWEEIKEVWQKHTWLFAVAGFLAGLLFAPLIAEIRDDAVGFFRSLVPEAIGIAFTVLFINNALDRQRDEARRERELKDRLVRDVRNPAPSIAMNAIDELRQADWLTGDNGLLKGTNLRMTNLSEANLSGANLKDANLERATLEETKLMNANLSSANLEVAKMSRADLTQSNLREAYLADADLEYASFMHANLESVMLKEANLHFANFTMAILINADLSSANLPGAILTNANLTNATCIDAEFSNADLFSADLTNADLSNATLMGTDLSNANLTGTNLTNAIFDEQTLLPDNVPWTPKIDLRKYGAIIEETQSPSHTEEEIIFYGEKLVPISKKDETQELRVVVDDDVTDGLVDDDMGTIGEEFGWTDDIDPGAFDQFFDDGDDLEDTPATDTPVDEVPYATDFGARILADDFVPDDGEVWEFEAIDVDPTSEQTPFREEVISQELPAQTADEDPTSTADTLPVSAYDDEEFETTVLGRRFNTDALPQNDDDDDDDHKADTVTEGED